VGESDRENGLLGDTPIEHPISLDSKLVFESRVREMGVRDVTGDEGADQGGAS